MRYTLEILTEEAYGEAGTNSTVSMQLVGDGGLESDWHVLDHFWRNDFKKGRLDEFGWDDKDVGKVIIVRIKIEHGFFEDIWCCASINVKYDGNVVEFPVYDWVSEYMEVVRGEAQLPQKVENGLVSNLRDAERKGITDKFQWVEKQTQIDAGTHLPRYAKFDEKGKLEKFFRFTEVREKHIASLQRTIKFNAIIEMVQSYIWPIKSLDDYRTLFSHCKIPGDIPANIEKWQEDEEFGRQMLNGTNPAYIIRCTSLPEHCSVKDTHLKGLLNPGKCLAEEMTAGRIYMMDFVDFATGLKRNKQYKTGAPLYCANTLALFYSSGDGRLLPIAIQLEPNNGESVFTPNDEKYDWMLAKMYFRCADACVHEFGYHFMGIHGVMEPVAFSIFRCLPKNHPVYKLLRPHFYPIVRINKRGRETLIQDGSLPSFYRSLNGVEVAGKAFERFQFGDLVVPDILRKNGVLDDKLLPNYHYRTDCLLLWDVEHVFVSKVIKCFYKSNEDVKCDFEIQNWVKELAMEGYAWDGKEKGCPTSFQTVEDLTKFVTTVIFTVTVNHAAHHYPGFDIYKFMPNAPGGMRLPIHKRGEGSLQRVLDSLPDVFMSTVQLGTFFGITSVSPDEVFLGHYPQRLFVEPEVQDIMKEFADNLKKASEKIKKRNEGLKYPYEYLLPEKIPASITA